MPRSRGTAADRYRHRSILEYAHAHALKPWFLRGYLTTRASRSPVIDPSRGEVIRAFRFYLSSHLPPFSLHHSFYFTCTLTRTDDAPSHYVKSLEIASRLLNVILKNTISHLYSSISTLTARNAQISSSYVRLKGALLAFALPLSFGRLRWHHLHFGSYERRSTVCVRLPLLPVWQHKIKPAPPSTPDSISRRMSP